MKKLYLLLILLVAFGCTVPCQAYSLERPADVNWYTVKPSQLSFYFSSAGSDPSPTLIEMYNSANRTIDIAIYSINNQKIVDAIIDANNRGIKIRIITDRKEALNKYQAIALSTLKIHNIPILINSRAGSMHIKMSIIDKSFVTVGSYDYTLESSQTNDEIMVVCTEPLSIQVCQDRFDAMWNDTKGFEKYGGNQ